MRVVMVVSFGGKERSTGLACPVELIVPDRSSSAEFRVRAMVSRIRSLLRWARSRQRRSIPFHPGHLLPVSDPCQAGFIKHFTALAGVILFEQKGGSPWSR